MSIGVSVLLLLSLLTALGSADRAVKSINAIGVQNQLGKAPSVAMGEQDKQELMQLAASNQRAKYWDLVSSVEGSGLERKTAIENSLALAPLNAFNWMKLVGEIHAAGGDAGSLVDTLVMSIYSSPYEPQLLVNRILFALEYFNYLDEDVKDLIGDQIKLAELQSGPRQKLENIRKNNQSARLKLEILSGM